MIGLDDHAPRWRMMSGSARQVVQTIIGAKALFLGERHYLVLAQDLGTNHILAAELLALDDPVVNRAMGLAKKLRGFARDAGADRRNVLLGQRSARERPDRRAAA